MSLVTTWGRGPGATAPIATSPTHLGASAPEHQAISVGVAADSQRGICDTDAMSAAPPQSPESTDGPESIDAYYARIAAAAGPDGRLPVAVDEMPGWDIYPYELNSLQLKPIRPPADEEPARGGEDPATCWCATSDASAADDHTPPPLWQNERWILRMETDTGVPTFLWLSPRQHCDITTMPADVAADIGPLMLTISAAVESLPSVGRVHVAKWGDGGAHLHLGFVGRPARMLQFRGSPLVDWEENLPRVPLDVLEANADVVANALVARHGGTRR